jgi:hypothetical protein
MADAVANAVAAAVAEGPADTSGADRHTLVIHVDGEHASSDRESVPVRESTGRIRSLSPRVLRRLACEAGIVLVSTDGDGSPVDVGRRDRRLSTALRRALLARDRSCRFPGCGATRHLHAHHAHHWGEGGRTDLANLVVLCGLHHRYVHDHDVEVEVHPAGAHRFRCPTRGTVPRAGRLPNANEAAPYDRLPVLRDAPSPQALQPDSWDGPGRFSLDTTVAVLQQELAAALPGVTLPEVTVAA